MIILILMFIYQFHDGAVIIVSEYFTLSPDFFAFAAISFKFFG